MEMEINKPGGFLLLMLDRLSDKNTTIEYIESKIRRLEQFGIITYDFIPTGFDDEYVSIELVEDLRVFIDIGWVEFIENEYKLTKRGTNKIKEFELPELAKDKFEKLFR